MQQLSLLTSRDVEILVSRVEGIDNVKVLKHTIEPFAESPDGIMGSHYLLKVHVDTGRVLTFFVKTRPESELHRDVVLDECIYEAEYCFNAEILPRMMEVYRGEKWCPQCYMATPNFFAFEDLRVQDYAVPKDVPIDEETLKLAVASLARFHACSLLVEAKLGKSLQEAYPQVVREKIYTDDTKVGRSTAVSYDTVRRIAEKFGMDASLVSRLHDHVHRLVRPSEGGLNVLSHCDLWRNNFMENSESRKLLLVDFQMLRYCSPAVDLSFLMYLNTTPEFRRTSELKMFDHYYATFKETLQRNNPEINVPTYDGMLRDYDEQKIVGNSYATIYLIGLYLDPEDIKTLLSDFETLKHWFFVDRMYLIAPTIDKDPVYARKLRDLFEELFAQARKVLE